MERNRVIALGFFDGVHRGHGALLRMARQRADELGLTASVLTFDAHPDQVVFGQEVQLLNTMDDRQRLMKGLYAMDEVLVAHFDMDMAQLPWKAFIEDFLIRDHGAAHVVCGHDFTFGWKGIGKAQKLRDHCASLGVGCDIIGEVDVHDHIVSSTYIRQLLSTGNVEEAAEFLGHPHFLTGVVAPGKQLGRRLGFPTANLPLPQGILPPAFGVYACKVFLEDGTDWIAVTNVGVRPTMDDKLGILVEPWLLDYHGDLYGRTIRVEFHKMLRGEKKFESLEALKEEIFRNAEETRIYFRTSRRGG